MKRIYLLHGGIASWDGIVTSSGMNILVSMLKNIHPAKGVGEIKSYLWANYAECYLDMCSHHDDTIIGIGYSGGAAHFTWVANGYREEWQNGKIRIIHDPKPRIDLLVLYDPSPKSGMMTLKGTDVKRCICYHSTIPLLFGLGGAQATGPMVETVPVRLPHLAVQFSMDLHHRTVREVEKLT